MGEAEGRKERWIRVGEGGNGKCKGIGTENAVRQGERREGVRNARVTDHDGVDGGGAKEWPRITG